MSLEKIVAEAMAGRPLEMKDAFAEEIELRIQTSLEEKYMEIVEAKKAKDDEDEDEDEDDVKDDEDEDDEDDLDEAKKYGEVHGAAIDDHTSASADHRDLSDDNTHHKAASKHHADAANALEYGRVKQANKSSAMAKASAAKAGDKDLSKTSAAIHAEHH